jgi:hypothetical protein
MENIWGLLGAEVIPHLRRTRTLGVGASVRSFNDLAVPGIGGVWYGKQLLLSTLGVRVAEAVRAKGGRVNNIEMTNAIEALACWAAFNSIGWERHERLRGNNKLKRRGDDFSFSRVRQRDFYVTQPMRMTTVEALPALGFVESASARFNAFTCSADGIAFVDEALKGYRPYRRTVVEHLAMWPFFPNHQLNTEQLHNALSPLVDLSDSANAMLRERLLQGGNESDKDRQRRVNAIQWVDEIAKTQRLSDGWSRRPSAIDEDHWADLEAGASFFMTRDAALALLNAVEIQIAIKVKRKVSLLDRVPSILLPLLDNLRSAAHQFLALNHGNVEANKFCRECAASDAREILRALITRDGHVLKVVGDEIHPGAAFADADAASNDLTDFDPLAQYGLFPSGISRRVIRLYRLHLDANAEIARAHGAGKEFI